MELELAEILARVLMNDHGLHDVRFEFSRAKTQLGLCKYKRVLDPVTGLRKLVPDAICLSYHFVEKNDLKEIRDTILHEIAHALTPGHKHDLVWRMKCREIGATPKRTCSAPMPDGKWQTVCPSCQKVFNKHRRPRNDYVRWCRQCGRQNGTLPPYVEVGSISVAACQIGSQIGEQNFASPGSDSNE